jgi:hypothetical protein
VHRLEHKTGFALSARASLASYNRSERESSLTSLASAIQFLISWILKQNDNDRDEEDLLSVKDLLSSECVAWIDLTGDSDYKVCHNVYEIRVITDTDLFRHVERPSVFSQAPKIRFWGHPRDARRSRTEGVSFLIIIYLPRCLDLPRMETMQSP